MSAKERYKKAYHRLRTLNSRRLIWEQDTYPVGFDCPRDCDLYLTCTCLLDAQAEHHAYKCTVAESEKLLAEKIDWTYMPSATDSLAGRFKEFGPKNYLLRRRLLLAKKKGLKWI